MCYFGSFQQRIRGITCSSVPPIPFGHNSCPRSRIQNDDTPLSIATEKGLQLQSPIVRRLFRSGAAIKTDEVISTFMSM